MEGRGTFRSAAQPVSEDAPARFDRIRQTPLMKGDAFARWQSATLGVIGVGNLGSRVAVEAVRSGTNVRLYDLDVAEVANLGTQVFTRTGTPKAVAVREICDQIHPGHAAAVVADIRHVGIGELAKLDLLVDCSDDAHLEWPLTEISNGLRIPLLRIAVDGSGDLELGRIQTSHGGGEAACRLCGKSLADLPAGVPRMACHGPAAAGRSTFAGGAIGMIVAGFGLAQAMRLVGGNELQQALNRHLIVDLDSLQLFPLIERRSSECLTGHLAWHWTEAALPAGEASLSNVFDLAEELMAKPVSTIEVYGHALFESRRCCGAGDKTFGTPWARPPTCGACGCEPGWQWDTRKERWSRAEAAAAGINTLTLEQLGFPLHGAMIVARAEKQRPLRMILGGEPSTARTF